MSAAPGAHQVPAQHEVDHRRGQHEQRAHAEVLER